MRKIIIYSASSMDGYIAKEDGDIEWLENLPNPEKTDYGYSEFYDSIDTTIMGNSTYQKIKSFDIPFPYVGKKSYVLSKNTKLSDNEDVSFSSKPLALIEKLKNESGKNIWVVGGGKINSLLLQYDLVDKLIISYIPIILGKGIKLFADSAPAKYFVLEDIQKFENGVLNVVYSKQA